MIKKSLVGAVLLIASVYADTAVEDVLKDIKIFDIAGTFGVYDFDDVDSAFDWVFTTSNGKSFQLQGRQAIEGDVFGWKEVDIQAPKPAWYMFPLGSDVDGDGSELFDWMLVGAGDNKGVYKLAGKTAEGTFDYSAKIDIDYNVKDTQVTFNTEDETLHQLSDGTFLISYPTIMKNETLKEGSINSYQLNNAKSGFDYYFKVKAFDSNPINATLDINFYSGEYPLKKFSVESGYTSLIQIENNSNEKLALQIKAHRGDEIYRYDLEVFQGLKEGLIQDTRTFEPNDYQKISYNIKPNTLYNSKVKAVDDPRDWYKIENVTTNEYCYFELIPDKNNPTGVTQRNLYIRFYDADGAIVREQVAETGIAYTYQVKALQNAPLYAKIYREIFNTGNGAGDTKDYRYSFKFYNTKDVKQDSLSFEPNNYADIATPIVLNTNYNSDVYGYSTRVGSSVLEAGNIDRSDWFVVKNASSQKEYHLTVTSSAVNTSKVTARNFMVEAEDDYGKIGSKETIISGNTKTIILKPIKDGNLYINFYGQYTKYNYKYNFSISEI